jgi:hypothetical protein
MLALLDRVLARASTLDLEHSIVVGRKRIRRRALPIRQVTGNALDGRKRSLLSHIL